MSSNNPDTQRYPQTEYTSGQSVPAQMRFDESPNSGFPEMRSVSQAEVMAVSSHFGSAMKTHDTVKEMSAINPDSEILFNFLNDYHLIGAGKKTRIGLSLPDGSKYDVIRTKDGEIQFEYDECLKVDGKVVGMACYDMVFSEVSGGCITYSYKDTYYSSDISDYDKANNNRDMFFKNKLSWREVLQKFVTVFKENK